MGAMVKTLGASAEVDVPPDWSAVPFPVACARCGHDLHGLSEPTCPACALSFRWADAVPIEQLKCMSCGYHLYGLKVPRCPECGKEFTWDEALANYHRQRKPLFEYQWRTKPVRSLFYTWWLALRPKKLWTTMEIHDPVRVRSLLASALVLSAGVALAIWMAFAIQACWVISLVYPRSWQVQRGISFLVFLSDNLWGSLESFWLIIIISCYVSSWMLSLLAALLTFQQSMYRLRIRVPHILCVAVYASIPLWVGIVVLGSLFSFWDGPVKYFGVVQRGQIGIGIPILVVTLYYSLRSVSLAYRDYLHMHHPWAVAISAHAIALLLIFALAIPLDSSGIGLAALQLIAETIGVL